MTRDLEQPGEFRTAAQRGIRNGIDSLWHNYKNKIINTINSADSMDTWFVGNVIGMEKKTRETVALREVTGANTLF